MIKAAKVWPSGPSLFRVNFAHFENWIFLRVLIFRHPKPSNIIGLGLKWPILKTLFSGAILLYMNENNLKKSINFVNLASCQTKNWGKYKWLSTYDATKLTRRPGAFSQICIGNLSKFVPISPPVYPGKAQNWLGLEGQAFAAFILI